MLSGCGWRYVSIEYYALQSMGAANLGKDSRLPAIYERGKRWRKRAEQYREQSDGRDAFAKDITQHDDLF